MLAITSVISLVLTLLAASGIVAHEGIVGLVFLVLILLIAETFGFWKGLVAAVGLGLVLVFFFLEPLYGFWLDDPQELLSLPLFLVASLIGGSLLQTSRALTRRAEAGQAQSNALLSMHRAIVEQRDPHASIAAVPGGGAGIRRQGCSRAHPGGRRLDGGGFCRLRARDAAGG